MRKANVVGVDGSKAALDDGSRVGEAAVAVAFEEAAVRRVPLAAVHVWIDVAVEPWFAIDDDHGRRSTRPSGRCSPSAWQEKYPDVEVLRLVEPDRCATWSSTPRMRS